MKKAFKAVATVAKVAYNVTIGDDIRTLTSSNASFGAKLLAGVSLASNFIPGGGAIAKVGVKLVAKEVAQAVEKKLVKEAGDTAKGIIYKRTDLNTGKEYIGQSKSMERYEKRQAEHSRANKDAEYHFEIVGRAEPGKKLDVLEQKKINEHGGVKNLENKRNQISEKKWEQYGIQPPKKKK
ncbi:hypothetical protein [Cohnella yongneupensis]|uniref:GIY-YIG domain-containing protein n=1 Tax=Cohnella yongneupensis TaxID=425006 RepID=A0ABW0QX12_9BACL